METAGLILVMQIGYPKNDQGEVSIKLRLMVASKVVVDK